MSSATPVEDHDRALRRRVHGRLVSESLGAPLDLSAPSGLRSRLGALLRDEAPLLAPARFDAVLADLVADVSGLGPLEPLLADPGITEVMINAPGVAYVERAGRLHPIALDLDAAGIVRIVDRILAPLGLRLDHASPMVDARLADGSRLHAMLPPLAIDGPCVTIRRFVARALSLEDFGVHDGPAEYLRWVVASGGNVLVSGGTGAGKTTLLGTLSTAIDRSERVVTIEETAELRLSQPHVVRLEARPSNAEGAGEVSVRSLVRAALRMRPDRIVVGEVRGAEALDMVQALNTGHDGSMSTIHANGAAEALVRLETLVLLAGSGLPVQAVRQQIGAAVDLVVHVARADAGGRVVREVAEPYGRGVRVLCAREHGALVPCAAPARPCRRLDAVPRRNEWLR